MIDALNAADANEMRGLRHRAAMVLRKARRLKGAECVVAARVAVGAAKAAAGAARAAVDAAEVAVGAARVAVDAARALEGAAFRANVLSASALLPCHRTLGPPPTACPAEARSTQRAHFHRRGAQLHTPTRFPRRVGSALRHGAAKAPDPASDSLPARLASVKEEEEEAAATRCAVVRAREVAAAPAAAALANGARVHRVAPAWGARRQARGAEGARQRRAAWRGEAEARRGAIAAVLVGATRIGVTARGAGVDRRRSGVK